MRTSSENLGQDQIETLEKAEQAPQTGFAGGTDKVRLFEKRLPEWTCISTRFSADHIRVYAFFSEPIKVANFVPGKCEEAAWAFLGVNFFGYNDSLERSGLSCASSSRHAVGLDPPGRDRGWALSGKSKATPSCRVTWLHANC